jgi:glyoxylase-like metal-dependent hydrolase (beta-lactamase superfamily II)
VPEIVVLVPGHARWTREGKLQAGCTITLIKGQPNIVVDTGGPDQREVLVAALAAAGVRPDEIDFVVNTHGHLDHVGNNNLFAGATFVLDVDIARHGEYWTHDFAKAPLVLGSANGDGAITVVPTPGHTDHDLTVMVPTGNGTVAIVGDLFEHEGDWLDHSWEEWAKHRPPTSSFRGMARCSACRDPHLPELAGTVAMAGAAGTDLPRSPSAGIFPPPPGGLPGPAMSKDPPN